MGNIVWYYDPVANAFPSFAPSLVPGGTVLLLGNLKDQETGAGALREVDLAGDTLRETNIDAVNAQLAALGRPSITDFNHDAQRLPNGDTAVLATTPRTIRINGRPTLYEGDMVLVLDQDFQVAWAWDPFAWLERPPPPRRWASARATGRTRTPSPGRRPTGTWSCPCARMDWVIKINYANGTGDGHVIWRLGQGGDFRIRSTAPSPWFSHQHDARYINDTTLVLFDNGNGRRRRNPRAQSRGQELVLDETRRVARLVVNADLGTYAPFTGSAQKLPNGNFVLDSPLVGETIEMLPDGRKTYVLRMNFPGVQYRTYIYPTLYGNAADSSLPSTPIPRRLARPLAVRG